MSETVRLEGAEEIRAYCRANRVPLFYSSTGIYNVMGADEWLGNLQFLNTVDAFDGRHPRVLAVTPEPGTVTGGIEGANNFLLAQPAVAERVAAAGPGAGILFLMFDEKTEELARGLGLRVALPPARLRQYLDSKVTTTRLADRAGVASVPNVLAKVGSYAELREVARELGPELVVQLPLGDSGATTFFISNESDYRPHAEKIAGAPEVKVMRRIRCRQTTIEGCVTRQGTLAGPLMTEMVGFPELSPFGGGWCGNEVFGAGDSALISPEIRRQAQHAVLAMGEELRREGYWGCFGLDLLLDQDSGRLYLGEMNPRITGASPLTTQAALDAGRPTLLQFHLLEWLGVEWSMDVAEYNAHWLAVETAGAWSQLIIEHLRAETETVQVSPESGIWRMGADGELAFVRVAFDAGAVKAEDEVFFMRTLDKGQLAGPGSSLGRLTARGRLMDDEYRLTARAKALIDGFRRVFVG